MMSYRDAVWKTKGVLLEYPVARVSEVVASGRKVAPEVVAAMRLQPYGVDPLGITADWRLESVAVTAREFLIRGFTAPQPDELSNDGQPADLDTYKRAAYKLAVKVAAFATALAALAPADPRSPITGIEWRTARLDGWEWPAEVVRLGEELHAERLRWADVAVRHFMGLEA